MERKLSRREVLKLGGVAAAGLFVFGLRYYLDPDNFFSLPETEPAPRFPLPKVLRGISVNSPFIWRLSEAQDKVLQRAAVYRPATMRLFVDDSIEPKLGGFNPVPLLKLASFVKKVEKMKDETGWAPGLAVDFGDCYGMLPRSSPVYGDSKPFSPYSDGSAEGYRQFFLPKLRDKYARRMKVITDTIGGSKAVVAWGIMNEASMPAGEDGKELLTDWMAEMVERCRQLDDNRPIMTGLAQPWLIDESKIKDENTVNTIHVYPFNPGLTLEPFHRYLADPVRRHPLYPQEIGFPSRLLGRYFPQDVVDRGYGKIVQDVLDNAMVGGRLETDGIGLWKLDGYDDGFPDPYTLPNTRDMLIGCRGILN